MSVNKNKLEHSKGTNEGLLSLNQYMLEQTEINDYEKLTGTIVRQLENFLSPVAAVYTEYDEKGNTLRIKEVKANQKFLDLAAKLGGNKILNTVSPVNNDMYESMTLERISFASTISEVTGGTIPDFISNPLSKAFNINCILVLAYVLDRKLFGTTALFLNERPSEESIELLRTYAYFTSISLKRINSEQALKQNELQLKTVTENMTDLVVMTDVNGKFIYLSGSKYDLLGYTQDELLGETIFKIVHEDDLPFIIEKFQNSIAKRKNDTVEYRAVKKDGSIIWLETIGDILLDDQDRVKGAVFTTRDINERKKAERIIQARLDLLEFSTQNNLDDVLQKTLDEVCAVVESPIGFYHFLSPDEKELTLKAWSTSTLEYFCKIGSLSDKSYNIAEAGVWVDCVKERKPVIHNDYNNLSHRKGLPEGHAEVVRELIVPIMRQGKIVAILGVGNKAQDYDHRDVQVVKHFADVAWEIVERKRTEEHIRYIGYHDNLTGLYNRHYYEYCKEELKNCSMVSVIMTDINGLKLVNDTYGHESGDELIKKYSGLIRKSFKKSDLFFRWGGDEFLIILKNSEEAKSWELCNRLNKHCGETFVNDIPLSISIGISSKTKSGDIDVAIIEAEDMMYKNKLNESKSSKNLIMKTLLQTLSEKSYETKEHIERMSIIGRRLGERLSLPPSELSRLETLTMLHDIGKINIDSRILLKKGNLTEVEWQEIRKHPEVGYRITRTAEEFAYIAEEILAHHERWDGKGYPQGLKEEDIPYLARVLNLIDSYDVMSNGRPYKKQMSLNQIIEEIERCAGTQFDPALAKEFITCLREDLI